MKKNILKIFIVCFAFLFSLNMLIKVNAEETAVDETIVEEEISVEEMFNDFINKWASSIFGALGGAGGMAIVIFISKKYVQKLIDKVMNNADVSEEQKKEAVEKLEQCQKTLESAEKNLTEKVEEVIENSKLASEEAKDLVDKVVNSSEETLAKFNKLQSELNQFKQLIGVLISTTPEFASNGVATKILELLDEGADSNVKEKN